MTNPITIAAAHAAGPMPDGGEAEWLAKVKRIAVDLTIADQDLGTKIELLTQIAKGSRPENGGTKGWGIVRAILTKVEVEERTKRGLLTYQAWDHKTQEMTTETIRTNFVSDPDAAAIVNMARGLIGHEVDLYKHQEPMANDSSRTVRLVAHLVDRGVATGGQRAPQASQQQAAPAQQQGQQTPPASQQQAPPAAQQAPPAQQQVPQAQAQPAQQEVPQAHAQQQGQADERIYQVNEAKTILFEQAGGNGDLAAEGWSYIGNPEQPLPHRLLARAVEYVRNKAQTQTGAQEKVA